MIHLTHSVTGAQVGEELGNDEEELAYALVAIADQKPDLDELRDNLGGVNQRIVRDFCNSIAIALGDD